MAHPDLDQRFQIGTEGTALIWFHGDRESSAGGHRARRDRRRPAATSGQTDDDPPPVQGVGSSLDEAARHHRVEGLARGIAQYAEPSAQFTHSGASPAQADDDGDPARSRFFAKDRFVVNLEDETVTCPNGVTVTIRRHVKGSGLAKFAKSCDSCPLRAQCTKSAKGRNIAVGLNEAVLSRARSRQRHPEWVADYRATRPKVERKLAHLMRRKHGGRRARVRGAEKVGADFSLLAAAVNVARPGSLGATSTPTGWTVAGA
jgi:Transposase DDE domain